MQRYIQSKMELGINFFPLVPKKIAFERKKSVMTLCQTAYKVDFFRIYMQALPSNGSVNLNHIKVILSPIYLIFNPLLYINIDELNAISVPG